jgi:hypothetical protein
MPAEYAGRLRGWRFILLNFAAGLANVVVLSNVPGYTILAPYAAANLQGVPLVCLCETSWRREHFICRAFERSRRRETLSFKHHAEVAALDALSKREAE